MVHRASQPPCNCPVSQSWKIAQRAALQCRAVVVGVVGLALLSVALSGCARGVRWNFGTFEDVHAQARVSDKLTFVYFRNWYMVECTEFEEQILKDPEVLAETDKFVCVPLSFDRDQQLAKRWGLAEPPAFVIVTPEGRVLHSADAPITKAELHAALRAAQASFSPATAPSP